MELLESDDPKSQLLKKYALHRNALEEQTKLISARTEKVLINALIIGGALATTFFLVRQFSGKKSRSKIKYKKFNTVPSTTEDAEPEDEVHIPGIVNQIGAAVASQATTFLLDLAKEKLSEYLQRSVQKEGEVNERS